MGFQDIALLLARVFLGGMFIVHGKGKVFGGLTDFSKYLKGKGLPYPFAMAAIAATIEFWGGIAMILGVFTQIVAVLMAVVMLVAIYVNLDEGKKFKGGWELDLMILTICIILMTFGGGAYEIASLL